MTVSRDDQPDLLSDLSDLDFVRHLLADLHDDLPGKVGRFSMLTDLGGQTGRSGTMIFGGHAMRPITPGSKRDRRSCTAIMWRRSCCVRGSWSICWRHIFTPGFWSMTFRIASSSPTPSAAAESAR
jgi:hypothetical protein